MMEAPAPVDPKQLEDLDIAIVERRKKNKTRNFIQRNAREQRKYPFVKCS